MSWFYWTIFLVFVGEAFGNGKPAVRVRVTQKGLDYAIDSSMKYAKNQLQNYPLPDSKGQILTFDYSFTDMILSNIDIQNMSQRAVPRKGLYTVLRNVDFDIKGKWKINYGWFANSGTFDVAVKGMSVGMLIRLGVNGSRLVVGNVTCASKLDNVNVNLKSGQTTSYLFFFVQNTVNRFIKAKIPVVACEEGKKAMKKNLNKQFTKFPVKQYLKKSVTLDYSVAKKPKYILAAVDLFLKGEFQPSNGQNTWLHQPAPLPRDNSRARMMYVTIMDHMINSAGHAYYNQDALKVQVTVKQGLPKVQILPTKGTLGRYLARVNAGLGALIKQSSCSNCNLNISISATSPPQIKTNSSGIHLTVQIIAKIFVAKNDVLHLGANVTAIVVPKLNGTKLSTNITNLNITLSVLNPSTLTTLSGRVAEIKKIVKKQIDERLKKGFSAMEIPLPLSKKFKFVKPQISYGQGYMTLETDVLFV